MSLRILKNGLWQPALEPLSGETSSFGWTSPMPEEVSPVPAFSPGTGEFWARFSAGQNAARPQSIWMQRRVEAFADGTMMCSIYRAPAADFACQPEISQTIKDFCRPSKSLHVDPLEVRIGEHAYPPRYATVLMVAGQPVDVIVFEGTLAATFTPNTLVSLLCDTAAEPGRSRQTIYVNIEQGETVLPRFFSVSISADDGRSGTHVTYAVPFGSDNLVRFLSEVTDIAAKEFHKLRLNRALGRSTAEDTGAVDVMEMSGDE